MQDFHIRLGSLTGAALAVDTNSPNTDAPTAGRAVSIPGPSEGRQLVGTIFADAACTVEGWVYSTALSTWVRIFTQAIATAFFALQVTNIPDDILFFLRVTVNGGGAKLVAMMLH